MSGADRRFAFLRGVNLGKRTATSADLRAAFEAMGFDDVATFIASGNVAFDGHGEDGAALEARIEAGLGETMGFEAATFVRSCEELAEVAAPERLGASPLAGGDGVAVHVVFLKGELPADLGEAVEGLRSGDDDFVAGERELYWLRRGKMSDSAAWRPLEKALRGRGTMRNLNTVRRMLTKFCAALLLALLPACEGPGANAGDPDGAPAVAFDTGTVAIETGDTTHLLTVELAETRAQRAHGLMERPSLPEDGGMLFLYPESEPGGGFYMFRTRIPLDIAFLDDEGRIIAIRSMVPCESPNPDVCPRTSPGQPFRAALEVNRGWFERHDVAEGDRVVLLETGGASP